MHGIILHEEYRERMKKLSPERLGKLIHNMFLVDEKKQPNAFSDDEVLDLLSEVVCGRLAREIKAYDSKSSAGKRGGAPKGNHNASKKQAENKQKTTEKQAENNQETSPISYNLLPISNNQIPITNLKENKKESDPFAEDVISYLNFKTGRHYRVTAKTLGYINGRVNEGYTTEDFKRVIDKKVKDWMGTDYEKYIQPSTLFAPSHFDQYLNQPEKQSQNDMFDSFLRGGYYGEDEEGGVCPDSQNNESRIC